jgi:hypothetical protein
MPHRHQRGEEYSSHTLMTLATSAVDGVSGQCHTSVVLYPQERTPWYPLDRSLGGP